jgi:hypothetical protein
MNLTLWAPQIHEEIFFAENGKLSERNIRKVLKEACWEKQLETWKAKYYLLEENISKINKNQFCER